MGNSELFTIMLFSAVCFSFQIQSINSSPTRGEMGEYTVSEAMAGLRGQWTFGLIVGWNEVQNDKW